MIQLLLCCVLLGVVSSTATCGTTQTLAHTPGAGISRLILDIPSTVSYTSGNTGVWSFKLSNVDTASAENFVPRFTGIAICPLLVASRSNPLPPYFSFYFKFAQNDHP